MVKEVGELELGGELPERKLQEAENVENEIVCQNGALAALI